VVVVVNLYNASRSASVVIRASDLW